MIYINVRLYIKYINNSKRDFYTILCIGSTRKRLSPSIFSDIYVRLYIHKRKNGFFIPLYLQTTHIKDYHHNTTQRKCNIHTHFYRHQYRRQ